MMFSDNHKISQRQLQSLLLLYFLGTSSLFLPAELAQESGRSCYIVMFIGGTLATIFSLLLAKLCRVRPAWTGVEWMQFLLGKKIGAVCSVLFLGKILVDVTLEIRIFSEILRRTMLNNTALWVLIAMLLFLAVCGMCRGMEGQARSAEILLFFVFVPFVALLIGVSLAAKQSYFLPVTVPEWSQLRRGAAYIQPLFQAMIFLLFLPPFLQNPVQVKKSFFGTCLVTTLLMTAITFLCVTVYGVEVLSHKIFPTLQIAERIRSSGIFLGRQDIFLLWFWMVSCFLYVSGALFFGCVCCSHILPKTKSRQRYWLFLLVPIVLIGALIPRDMEQAYQFRNIVQPFVSAIVLGIFPILFDVKYRLYKRRASA